MWEGGLCALGLGLGWPRQASEQSQRLPACIGRGGRDSGHSVVGDANQ